MRKLVGMCAVWVAVWVWSASSAEVDGDGYYAPTAAQRAATERLVPDLASEDYEIREEANRKLQSLGPVIRPILEQQCASSGDPEARLRLTNLITRWHLERMAVQQLPLFRFCEALSAPTVVRGRYTVLPWSPTTESAAQVVWGGVPQSSAVRLQILNPYARLIELTSDPYPVLLAQPQQQRLGMNPVQNDWGDSDAQVEQVLWRDWVVSE
ncbi:MAG: hypothetical protein AMXMBFR7_38710 [Planctomycetota bacterium]